MDIRPPGEGAESVELEPEESLDPEACFTEGVCVYVCLPGIPYAMGTKCHIYVIYSPKARLLVLNFWDVLGVHFFTELNCSAVHSHCYFSLCLLLRLCDEVSVLSGRCGEGKREELVDSQENLLHHCRAQLV